MPDIPESAITAGAEALQDHTHAGEENPWRERALAVLEAAAPILAEHVAAKITAHMESFGPHVPHGTLEAVTDVGTRYRTWRRHFGIAARIAASAFYTDEDMRRLTAEALNRGDYVACFDTEPREDGDRG